MPTYSYSITLDKPINYIYSQADKPVFRPSLQEKKITLRKFSQVSYSHYYDWLKQEESIVESSPLTDTHSLELTNKNLLVKQPQKILTYPLHTIQQVKFAFKRLLLPLISGGISAPLFGIALWNQLLNFWFGLGIVMLSVSLLYYGWLGTHQISIELQHQQIHYFADQKTPELQKLVAKTNKVIKERKANIESI